MASFPLPCSRDRHYEHNTARKSPGKKNLNIWKITLKKLHDDLELGDLDTHVFVRKNNFDSLNVGWEISVPYKERFSI